MLLISFFFISKIKKLIIHKGHLIEIIRTYLISHSACRDRLKDIQIEFYLILYHLLIRLLKISKNIKKIIFTSTVYYEFDSFDKRYV